METKKTPLGPQPGKTMTEEDWREWNEFLRSIGVRPAAAPWTPFTFVPIKPRFYLLRKWVIWPVRRLIRRHLLR